VAGADIARADIAHIAKARELFDRALAQFPESPQREELRRQAEALVGEG